MKVAFSLQSLLLGITAVALLCSVASCAHFDLFVTALIVYAAAPTISFVIGVYQRDRTPRFRVAAIVCVFLALTVAFFGCWMLSSWDAASVGFILYLMMSVPWMFQIVFATLFLDDVLGPMSTRSQMGAKEETTGDRPEE